MVATAWKVLKYGVFSGPYFPVFTPNTGKYGAEKTLYLDIFHEVSSVYDLVELKMASMSRDIAGLILP